MSSTGTDDMNFEEVNNNSTGSFGTHQFDTEDNLKIWGFTSSTCACCGAQNSDVGGLLIQCGMCKKTYYCSQKCFNEHLPIHQEYCGTDRMYSDTKRKEKAPDFIKEKADLSKILEEKKKKAPVVVEDDDESESSSDSDSSHSSDSGSGSDDDTSKDDSSVTSLEDVEEVVEEVVEEPEVAEEEEEVHELVEVVDDDDDEPSLSLAEDEIAQKVEDEFIEEIVVVQVEGEEDLHYRIRRRAGPVPERQEYEAELVDLREIRRYGCAVPDQQVFVAEVVDLRTTPESPRPQYGWAKPDWVLQSPLRKTKEGEIVKNKGDLANPITNVRILLETGKVEWQKPDWVIQSPLKGSRTKKEEGEGTAANPLTHAKILIVNGKVEWVKPEWTYNPPLKPTEVGGGVKMNGNGNELANPVTDAAKVPIYEKRDVQWVKPDWVTNSPLKSTKKGMQLKSGGGDDIVRSIGGIKPVNLDD